LVSFFCPVSSTCRHTFPLSPFILFSNFSFPPRFCYCSLVQSPRDADCSRRRFTSRLAQAQTV
jgi:hypothetical protein